MAADIFRNNRDAYRGAILYEAKSNTPVEQVYKKMKKVLEDDDLDYVEFEYLYYQLRNNDEQFDSDIVNEQNYSGINDLPILVAKQIVSDLDPMERVYMRMTSRWFRDAIDKVPVDLRRLEIHTIDFLIRLHISFFAITYTKAASGCYRKRFEDSQIREKQVQFIDEDFVEKAMNDLLGIMRIPSFSTEEFCFSFDDQSGEINRRVIDSMRETLETNNINGFAAKKLVMEVQRQEEIPSILNLFRKTELKTLFIELLSRDPLNFDLNFLNQWQSIDRLQFSSNNINNTLSSLNELRNFKVFSLACSITAEDYPTLVKIMKTSEKFERAYFRLPLNVYEGFATFLGVPLFFPIDDPIDHRILGEEYSTTVNEADHSITIRKNK